MVPPRSSLVCSYWTDNGACYYYYTGNYSNYEEALVAVKTYADKQGIPLRYLQARPTYVSSLCVCA